MKTVMCFGTFDLLHLGHLHYFQQAKQYGDHLTVVVARDHTKQQQKKNIIFSEQERLHLVGSLQIVDEAVLGYPDDHLRIIIEKKPDVLCLGYDQEVQEEQLQDQLAKRGWHPEIQRMLPYHSHQFKSSLLKQTILKMD